MIEIIPNFHPLLVHFPIALIAVSAGTLFLGLLIGTKNKFGKEFLIVSRWSLWFAAFMSIFTIIAGFDAYYSVAHDKPSHDMMTIHRNWGLSTFVLLILLTFWSVFTFLTRRTPSKTFCFSMILLFLLVMTTGWYGGEVVYRYGLGVMSLPKVEGPGHDHSHEDSSAHDH